MPVGDGLGCIETSQRTSHQHFQLWGRNAPQDPLATKHQEVALNVSLFNRTARHHTLGFTVSFSAHFNGDRY